MKSSLILLVVSASLIILFILIRSVELKKGKFFLPKRIRLSADNFLSKISLAVFRNIGRIKKLIKAELSILPTRILKLTHFIWSKTRQKIDKFYEKMHNVHNHKIVKKDSDMDNHKGSVSIYWKSVTEDLKK